MTSAEVRSSGSHFDVAGTPTDPSFTLAVRHRSEIVCEAEDHLVVDCQSESVGILVVLQLAVRRCSTGAGEVDFVARRQRIWPVTSIFLFSGGDIMSDTVLLHSDEKILLAEGVGNTNNG